MKAKLERIDLQFINPGKTSRGTLYSKPSWILLLQDNGRIGAGECSVIPGLNPEYDEDYENRLLQLVNQINSGNVPDLIDLDPWPSIRFGLEMALTDLKQQPCGVLFPSDFTKGKEGIPINGLIWMGSKEEMQQRIAEKLDQGFRVLKLKVGALDFEEELSLLKSIRSQFSPADLEIRLDANGAFSPDDALEKLKKLKTFHIHSIEQPVKPRQWDAMAGLCESSPIAIALDEELIGVHTIQDKQELLDHVGPHFIILKPSLLGGFEKSSEWIDAATRSGVGWWATSALESNIGLSAIAQWVFTYKSTMVQGLGTGGVFSNNYVAPVYLRNSTLRFDPSRKIEVVNAFKF